MKNYLLHFHEVNKHRWRVFTLMCRAGFPFQGLIHDLSKYSPTEFKESAKFFVNKYTSPIANAMNKQGYSLAWLHHKGRNKHHPAYWFDINAPLKAPIIPFKYCVEMICDRIAACKGYKGKGYKDIEPYYYWNKTRDKEYLNRKIQSFITEVLELLGVHGEKIVINKKYLKKIYDKCIKMTRKDLNE